MLILQVGSDLGYEDLRARAASGECRWQLKLELTSLYDCTITPDSEMGITLLPSLPLLAWNPLFSGNVNILSVAATPRAVRSIFLP